MYSLHALRCLTCYVDKSVDLKLGREDMKMLVEAGAFTPLRDDGQLWLRGAAHEQKDVYMPCFSVERK